MLEAVLRLSNNGTGLHGIPCPIRDYARICCRMQSANTQFTARVIWAKIL
jgi:hypothetical protein